MQPDDPLSRGQCGVSSVWLGRYFARQGVETYVTEGIIHLRGDDDHHVWVELRDVGPEPIVVDVASDQYRSSLGAAVHVGPYGFTDETIGRYTPETHMDLFGVLRRKLMGRYALMEDALKKVPRKYRLHIA